MHPDLTRERRRAPPCFRLEGRTRIRARGGRVGVAVVTGAGQGLGRAIVTRLADDGHRIVAIDLDGKNSNTLPLPPWRLSLYDWK